MKAASEAEGEEIEQSVTITEETLFTDINYLATALTYLNQTENHPVEGLSSVSGLDIKITEEMRRRLSALLPEEALPQGDTLRLSDDKTFCMSEMQRSMQNNMAETAWPKTQYLWPLHPVLTWVNDKAGLFFGRGEAPILGLPGALGSDETIYIVAGSFPNKKSTPLIDEWFGVLYKGRTFKNILSINELIQKTEIRGANVPNTNCIKSNDIAKAQELLPEVVEQAKAYLEVQFEEYQKRMNPLLDEEVNKLIELQEKHHKYYQETLFEHERKLEEKKRSVDELFDSFIEWMKDTLEIQNNPYIRIVAVLTGVAQ